VSNQLPLVSVVVVNYNGKEYVESCVASVLGSTYANLEVIVIDNGSTDGSVEHLNGLYGAEGRFRAVELDSNMGPAYARNRAVDTATGKYIAFLDNDTETEPGWLEPLVEAMEEDPTIGACQCKLLLMNQRDRIDYVGDYMSNLGFLIQRVPGGEIDTGQADSRVEILSAKSAGMCMRAEAFREAGGFDEDYFIYVEETDLGWRVWLAGYRIIFVPESRVYHEFGTSQVILGDRQNYMVKYHGTKNYITTLLKNLGTSALLRVVPIHVALWLGIAAWSLLKGQGREARYILGGIGYVFFNIGAIMRKRRGVQRSRKIADSELLPKIMQKRELSYFYRKLTVVHKVGNASGFYRPRT
jgi:GT2 family glycosyltransferase